MVKQSVLPMSGIFSSQRFGRPQLVAAALLHVFVGECAWLVAHEYPNAGGADEFVRIEEGLAQFHGLGVAGTPAIRATPLGSVPAQNELYDPHHSPLWYLIAAAPIFVFHVSPDSVLWMWLTRGPFVLLGALLGASLWYVSRRLYGNAGGYIALALYCFSPAVLRSSSLWVSSPNIAAAWGTFGAVFTAIAVSHTLYAPREVVLWNWRRILLLGISLALAVGSQFSLVIVIPVLAAFMLYLAHQRRAAAIVILGASCFIGVVLVFSAYSFHPRLFSQGLAHARLLDVSGRAAGMSGAYLQVIKEVASSGPVLVLLAPAALLTYIACQRSRYFGNTAPLIVALLFMALRVAAPHDVES